MKKSTKIVLIILTVFVLIIGGSVAGVMIMTNRFEEKIEAIKIVEPDLSTIPDGAYLGEYDATVVRVKVEVHVEEGIIKEIKILEHANGQGEPAEKIVDVIIAQQKVDVDSISGATYSSKVIKQAVVNALTGK